MGMDATIRVFKTFFGQLWLEHLLYASIIDKSVNLILKKLEKFCSLHDWDAEIYLEQILQSNDGEKITAKIKNLLQNAHCSCVACEKLKRECIVEEKEDGDCVMEDTSLLNKNEGSARTRPIRSLL